MLSINFFLLVETELLEKPDDLQLLLPELLAPLPVDYRSDVHEVELNIYLEQFLVILVEDIMETRITLHLCLLLSKQDERFQASR